MPVWQTPRVIRRHPVLSTVAGAYVASLAWITLTPAPFGGAFTALLARLADAAPDWITLAGLQITSNVVLFAPFGALFVAIFGRRRWLGVLFASFICSCWIALAQAVWLPTRDASPYFVLAQVCGCAIGVAIAAAMTRRGAAASRSIEQAAVGNH